MARRSITQKVVQHERRSFDDQRTSAFSTFAVFAFWIAASTAAIALAGFSYYNADWEARAAFASNGIDLSTTASLQEAARRHRTATLNAVGGQTNRLNDTIRVIQRLRKEQTLLMKRVVELDTALRSIKDHAKFLEARLEDAVTDDTATTRPPDIILPDAPLARKSVSEASTPATRDGLNVRSVQTRRVPSTAPSTQPSSLSLSTEATASKKDQRPGEGQSFVAKTRTTQSDARLADVDTTVTSAIAPTRSQFAIDLGVAASSQGAESLWSGLKNEQPVLLQRLQAKFLKADGSAKETRVVAGPYPDAADAIRTCVILRRSENFCKTTLFPD
ncbi:MAG: hypothetical protein AAFW47_00275 [Pseudomonadota bacterium]